MEGPDKNRLEDLTSEERQKLISMGLQYATIQEYITSDKISKKRILELDHLLNESYDEFLPARNTEKLRDDCIDFFIMLDSSDRILAGITSEYMKTIVGGPNILNKNQVFECKELISRMKEITIPRLKSRGNLSNLKLLEGAIMQLEIKVANDDE